MVKNLKKSISIFLSLCMVLTLIPYRSYAADSPDGFKEREIKEISIDFDDLIVGQSFRREPGKSNPDKSYVVLDYTTTPIIQKFSSSNPENMLQIQLSPLLPGQTYRIIYGPDGRTYGENAREPYKSGPNGMKTGDLNDGFGYKYASLTEACELNEDGSVKVTSEGEPVVKTDYALFQGASPELPEKVEKGKVYYQSIDLQVGGVHVENDVFDRKIFSNELSGRTVLDADSKPQHVPRFLVNGTEVYSAKGLDAVGGTLSLTNGTGGLYLYAKELIEPTVKVNADKKISENILPVGETIEKVLSSLPKFTVDDEDKDKYYVKETSIVSKGDNGTWNVLEKDKVTEIGKTYAVKLVLSPKVFYKFNSGAPTISGTVTNNKYTVSREGRKEQDIVLLLDYADYKYNLKGDDLEFKIEAPVAQNTIPFPEEQVAGIVKGYDLVDFSGITWLEVDKNSDGIKLKEVGDGQQVFEKDKEYKAVIDITPKEHVNVNLIPEILVKVDGSKNGAAILQKYSNMDKYYVMLDFTPVVPTIESIKISPENVELTTGNQLELTVEVIGEHNPSKKVKWEVSNNKSNRTVVSDMGILKVSENESSDELTVKATSLYDGSKTTSVMLKVKNPVEKPKAESKVYKLNFDSDVVSAMVDGTGVESGNVVEENKEVELKLNIPQNRQIKSFMVNDEEEKSKVKNNEYRFNIVKDTTVKLVLEPKKKQHKVSFNDNVSATLNGVVLQNEAMVDEGSTVVFNLDVQPNKEIVSFNVNNVDVKGKIVDNKFTLEVKEDVNVVLTLKDKSTSSNPSTPSVNPTPSNPSAPPVNPTPSTPPSKPNPGGGSSSSKSTPSSGGGSGSTATKKEDKKEVEKPKEEVKPQESLANQMVSDEMPKGVLTVEEATRVVNKFSDVSDITWSKNSVVSVISKGIMQGRSDGSFAPKAAVTRAEVAQVISNILKTPVEKNISLSDVSKDKWYHRAVQTVVAQNIFSGYENGNFRPEAHITRAELFVTIAKLQKLAPLSEKETQTILSKYQDANQVPTWARGYVSALVKAGIVEGTNNNIEANSKLTREQLAVVFANISK